MQKVDTAELRRLHEAATKGVFWQEEVAFSEASKVHLPALLDELEAARLEMRRQGSVIAELREEVRRLTQANGDLRKERDRAVEEAQRQDRIAKGLRQELREESNRWVSIIRAIDPEALCDLHSEMEAAEWAAKMLADARRDRARVEAWEWMNRNGCRPGCEYDPDRGFIGWGWKHDTYKTWREAMDAAMGDIK